jgi:drug/metabolite transporter (DMT)-like permease
VSGTGQTGIVNPRVLIPFTLVTLIWGSTWLVILSQLGVVPPGWSVTYRFALSAIFILGYAVATGQSLRLGRRGQMFAMVFGVAQFVLNFNFVYRAEGLITSGLVAVVFALLVVPNALGGSLVLGQPITRRFLTGSAVAVAGIALLFINELRADPGAQRATLGGIALTGAGVLSASVANIMQATARAKTLPMASLLGWGMVWGALADALVAWLTVGPPVFDMRLTYILGLGYLAFFASAVAFMLYFSVIRAIGPGKAAYSSVIIPILAMLLSTLFEGYHWTGLAVGGGAVTLIGLVIALGGRGD